jgi:hypothetical protein
MIWNNQCYDRYKRTDYKYISHQIMGWFQVPRADQAVIVSYVTPAVLMVKYHPLEVLKSRAFFEAQQRSWSCQCINKPDGTSAVADRRLFKREDALFVVCCQITSLMTHDHVDTNKKVEFRNDMK